MGQSPEVRCSSLHFQIQGKNSFSSLTATLFLAKLILQNAMSHLRRHWGSRPNFPKSRCPPVGRNNATFGDSAA